MANTTVHIINHTHWDREWFLTSIYTSQWIPGLIDRLEELVAANDAFHYLLDGQTLIIEDLLEIRPDYAEKVERLVSAGNLIIGPYYCQPDWQLTSGETLMRNLHYGGEIMARFGGKTDIGWLVDTFGHISQAPQIHQKHGIETVYVWRGVPQLEPYFNWHGTAGYNLFAIDLFGGYRNLYGVTHAPTVAELRLQKEAEQLAPYYPTDDIPLFDGYDLEDNPEDPVRWLTARNNIPNGLQICEATPMSYAQTMREKLDQFPAICGELNSGKFGATFPGTFSSRAYLKLLGHDCEHLLYHVVEPLAALATLQGGGWSAEKFKGWAKTILQNSVHDAICGVSIDQVHEKMEYSYRQIFGEMTAEIERLLPTVCQNMADGHYMVNTTPQAYEKWEVIGDQLIALAPQGLGVFPLAEGAPVARPDQAISQFNWQNDHYSASVDAAGLLTVDGVQFGEITVSAEAGDTYSNETKEVLGRIIPNGDLLLEAENSRYALLSFEGQLAHPNGTGYVQVIIRYTFDPSPLIGVEIELDSRGTDFHVELWLTPKEQGAIWAGMPFDRVQRPRHDDDLLPRQLDSALSRIMMGQRELNTVRTFPMHRFVGSVREDGGSAIIFSRGNRSYRSWENGQISISLRRSVEWVTEADLENRIGDAGPFFYVPDARCERTTRHEIALYVGKTKPTDPAFNQLEAGFSHTPLLIEVTGSGEQAEWLVTRTEQPVSAVWPEGNRLMGRIWHAHGQQQGLIEEKSLATNESVVQHPHTPAIQLLKRPIIRIGHNQGLPDQKIVDTLRQKANHLARHVEMAKAELASAKGHDKLKIEHQLYIYDRERHEFLLSIYLNEQKLAQKRALNHSYLYELDETISEIGHQLNQLRIKRRIFDYVATVL